MHKFFTRPLAASIAILFSSFNLLAQAPQAIPFQAAVRNTNGVLVANKTITVRFSIRNGFSYGNIIYREWQTAATNTQGLFVLNVGQGNIEIGQFAAINWSDSTKFMQVEIDTTNSRSVWRDIGTQQMLSVPYSLNARKADTASVAVTALSALNGVPTGSMEAFAGPIANIPPVGWAYCDGSIQSITDPKYINLFKVIGYAWGKENGGASFRLPYTLGLFLRGQANGSGWDPDRDSRSSIHGTGFSGDQVGSFQSHMFQNHSHTFFNNYLANGPSNSGGGNDNNKRSAIREWDTSKNPGGNETRPTNVNVNYIIKL